MVPSGLVMGLSLMAFGLPKDGVSVYTGSQHLSALTREQVHVVVFYVVVSGNRVAHFHGSSRVSLRIRVLQVYVFMNKLMNRLSVHPFFFRYGFAYSFFTYITNIID